MSDSDGEEYAFFGTAVEPLEEDGIYAKKAPRLEDQIVTDQQGKRRFHGAFTGGFSAGHFNTVGSIEGFTPSTFTSSRADRKKNVQQIPAMFMDEEDVGDHGIAPQRLQTTMDFQSSSDSKRKRHMPDRGPIPGAPALLDLVAETSNNIGVRMLKSLGWKEGQGIGPRLSAREKKKRRNLMKKRAGRNRDSDSDPDLPDNYSGVTLAPDDAKILDVYGLKNIRTNTFGLGYIPLSRENILGKRDDEMMSSKSFNVAEEKKTFSVQGQAFGVGAFEDDDEDVYTHEDMSHYDFVLGGGGGRGSKSKGAEQHSMFSIKAVTESLDNFTLSSTPVSRKSLPPLPNLPPNYTSRHTPYNRRFSVKPHELAGMGRHDITHEDRKRILEGYIPPPPGTEIPSITTLQPIAVDEMESHSVDRNQQQLTEEESVDQLSDEEQTSGPTNNHTTFKPFAIDPKKQGRYELYLKMKDKGMKSKFREVQPSFLTDWEKNKEEREFDRSSQLFKPLSFTMSTRFVTSATEGGKDPLLKEGLNVSVKKIQNIKVEPGTSEDKKVIEINSRQSTSPSKEIPHQISSNSRVNAARSSMYGRLTLIEEEWHPDNVLCRRFNIPNPYPDSRTVGLISSSRNNSDRVNIFGGLVSASPTLNERGNSRDGESKANNRGSKRDDNVKKINQENTPTVDLSDVSNDLQKHENSSEENYGLKVPVDGPPTMDLFKAIFNDSSSSSSDSDCSDNDKAESNGEINQESDDSDEDSFNKEVLAGKRNKSRFEPRIDSTNRDEIISLNDHEEVNLIDNPPKHVFFVRKKDNADKDVIKVGNSKKKTKVKKSKLSFAVELFNSSDSNDEKESNDAITIESKISPECSSNASKKSKQGKDHSKQFDNENENLRKICDKSSGISSKIESESRSGSGIFSNIDFRELNKYRELMNEEEDNNVNKDCVISHRKMYSSDSDTNSSSDSETEGEFGASLPPNFVNPMQTIRQKSDKATLSKSSSMSKDDEKWREVSKRTSKKKKKKKKNKESKSKHKSKSHKKEKKKKKNSDKEKNL